MTLLESLMMKSDKIEIKMFHAKRTLSGEFLSGEIFVGRNYSSGEIFVPKRKIRHFR